jgi:hypothetical protein
VTAAKSVSLSANTRVDFVLQRAPPSTFSVDGTVVGAAGFVSMRVDFVLAPTATCYVSYDAISAGLSITNSQSRRGCR